MHTQRISIIIPTYNERANIAHLIRQLMAVCRDLKKYDCSVLVVDDCSPDGTGKIVQQLQAEYAQLHLLTGKKAGLGEAYLRGYTHAQEILKADIVVGMDADLSHNPKKIPELVQAIEQGSDVAIGSRYVPGGSIPEHWSLKRRLNSRVGNFLARYVGGLHSVHDCTGAFRAFKTSFLRRLNLRYVGAKGYVFLVGLLHLAQKQGARISEIPIQFRDRTHGTSKLKLKDIAEFILYCFDLAFKHISVWSVLVTLATAAFITVLFLMLHLSTFALMLIFLTTLSSALIGLALFNLYLLVYAWEDVRRIEASETPQQFLPPQHSFTALIPAREEQAVIADTIAAVHAIQYPTELCETFVICRVDDQETIVAAEQAIKKLGATHISVLTFSDTPINKPHALNVGLRASSKGKVVIFDAEDQPHPEIYQVANTRFIQDDIQVLQAGVQLMNYNSRWFSSLNVLEYFFWFKSALHFFAANQAMPLGGNTVFFDRGVLERTGGWDESCLTEDADIGIRLSASGARFGVVYDFERVTQEETPLSIQDFVQQRTRWIQGFVQIALKGEWRYLNSFTQRALVVYVLTVPILQLLTTILLPVALAGAVLLKLPILVALYTYVPFLILALQFAILNIGFAEFLRRYGFSYSMLTPFKLLVAFLPYQLLLNASAVRAIWRELRSENSWEKTTHANAHRTTSSHTPENEKRQQYAFEFQKVK